MAASLGLNPTADVLRFGGTRLTPDGRSTLVYDHYVDVGDTLAKGVASLLEHRAYIQGLGNEFDAEDFLTNMAGFGGMAAGCDLAVQSKGLFNNTL